MIHPTAILRPTRAFFGDSVADRLSAIQQLERGPGTVDRSLKSAEVASLLAWALTGFADGADMPLLAIQCVHILGEPSNALITNPQQLRTTIGHRTFGESLWSSLMAGTGEKPYPVEREEHLSIALGERSAAASVGVNVADGSRFILHFGRLARGDRRIALAPYNIDAVSHAAALMIVPGECPTDLLASSEQRHAVEGIH